MSAAPHLFSPVANDRRGAVLALALVLLLVLAVIAIATTKTLATARRQGEFRERFEQARWMAAAAVDRAALRLRSDGAYAGEVWEIPAESMDGVHAGVVEIKVVQDDNQPKAWVVQAVAAYPADRSAPRRAVFQQQISIQPRITGESP